MIINDRLILLTGKYMQFDGKFIFKAGHTESSAKSF